MRRTHAEPERVKGKRCASCGLPTDPDERKRLSELVAVTHPQSVWALCVECAEPTCRELRRRCAEEAEREALRGGDGPRGG